MRRAPSSFALLLPAVLLGATACFAQPTPPRKGVLHLTDWPRALLDEGRPLEPFADLDVLPFLDTLALEYTYGIDAGRPALTFTLWWVPDDEAILDGRRVPYDALPADVRLTALDVRADVFVRGERVTELIISVDGMALSPAPYVHPFEGVDLAWETLFADGDAETAQRYFREGFELRHMEVLRIAFTASDAGEPDVTVTPRPRPPARPRTRRPEPRCPRSARARSARGSRRARKHPSRRGRRPAGWREGSGPDRRRVF